MSPFWPFGFIWLSLRVPFSGSTSFILPPPAHILSSCLTFLLEGVFPSHTFVYLSILLWTHGFFNELKPIITFIHFGAQIVLDSASRNHLQAEELPLLNKTLYHVPWPWPGREQFLLGGSTDPLNVSRLGMGAKDLGSVVSKGAVQLHWRFIH